MSRKTRRSGTKRSYRFLIVPLLVLVTAIVGFYIFTQANTTNGYSPLVGQPVSATVLSDLAGVTPSTLAKVGSGASAIQNPASISGAPLTFNNKPEVLYMGAEYCPYCGAERWAMIVALDKFGSFTGIEYMQSSSTDVYASTPTFTFVDANYTSSYISFVTVEMDNQEQVALQTPTTAETTLMNTYDSSSGAIPFVDFGNQYTIESSSYLPNVLRVNQDANGAAYNWTQIASQLNNSSSIFAQNIDGTANRIISAICKIDGGAPSSVCSQSFATLLSYTVTPQSGGSQLLLSDALLRGPAPPAAAARFAPTRLIDRV